MHLRELTKELQNKVENELNEVPDRIESDIETIKEWIRKQPHLNARTEDQWILGFLRGCKFSLQRTKEKIDSYYTIRTLIPDFFSNRDPLFPEIQEVLNRGTILPLPTAKNSTDPQVILFRWNTLDPDIVTCYHTTKTYFMMLDILLTENDNSVISGEDIFVDCKEFPMSYILQLTPMYMKQFVICTQKAYPIRMKGLYTINAPPVFEAVFKMLKSFMTDKLRDRTFLYGTNNTHQVYNTFSKSRLPREYGGSCGSVDELAAFWKKKVESYRDWFLDDSKYCTNEDLRLGKPKTSTELFGVEGSFRKLAID